MKPPASIKRFKKNERTDQVLFGLIRLYLKTLKPVGSNSLRENGFEDLSSATIRNYFADLEIRGLLEQPHTSGGRIPTWRAFKLFAREKGNLPKPLMGALRSIARQKTRKIFEFLQQIAEQLSEWSGGAAFLTTPHFEQDSIIDLHLVKIDSTRLLGALVTGFGQVHTYTLLINHKLSEHALRRIEQCLRAELQRTGNSGTLSPEERKSAEQLYQELLTRYLLEQSDARGAKPHKTGFSRLLKHPSFHSARTVAGALELFENEERLGQFTRACQASSDVHAWIGEELTPFSKEASECAICAVNYQIGSLPVGAAGVLVPLSSDFPSLFALLTELSKALSRALESNITTYKLSYRPAEAKRAPYLLENKRIPS